MNNPRIKPHFLISFLLVLITLIVYSRVLNHHFIDYDDNSYVTENGHVKSGLTVESIKWAFTTGRTGNWHPLTWISLMSDFELFGLNPTGYHLTNLLLHIANSVLLFMAFMRMTKTLWSSAFVAAVFALHPLHAESVAWIAERKDVLSALFWILTMWAYIGYVEHSGAKRYLLVILFFAIGLLAKPMLVTLPFVLLLLDYWPLGRFKPSIGANIFKHATRKQLKPRSAWSSLLLLCKEKIPLFALAIASSIVTFFVQQGGGAVSELSALPLDVRIANALVAYVEYMGKTIWPSHLAIFYPHTLTMLPLLQVASAGIVLVATSAIAVWKAKSHPYLPVGWFWYLGTLVPVIGIVQVGLQSMADRYMYLPLIGLTLVMGWGIPSLAKRWRIVRGGLAVLTGVVLVALTIRTRDQLRYWRNSFTVFEHAITVTDRNYVAHTNLADALRAVGRNAEAITQYSEALRINPNHADAHNNLGAVLEQAGQRAEAMIHYEKALSLKPNFAKVHYNFGAALGKEGKLEAAAAHLYDALKIDPEYLEAHNNLAIVLALQGKNTEAIAHLSEVIRGNPDDPAAYYNLGLVQIKAGRLSEAIANFSHALRIKPDYAEAQAEFARAQQLQQGKQQ